MPETSTDAVARKAALTAELPLMTAFDGGYWEGVQRMQKECAAFIADRLAHDRTTLEELSRCTDVADVMAVQQRWVARWGEAYMREVPKLASIALETFAAAPRATAGQAPERRS